jgi:hypothetical protein
MGCSESSRRDRGDDDSNEAGDAGQTSSASGASGASGNAQAGGTGTGAGAGEGGASATGGNGATGGGGATGEGGANTGGTDATGGTAATGGASGGASGSGATGGGQAGGGGSSAGSAGTGGSGNDCGSGPLSVLLLVDASLSMQEEVIGEGATRWDITRDALSSAIEALPSSMRVGMVFFPQVATGEMPCFEPETLIPVAELDDAHRNSCVAALQSVVLDGSSPTLDAYAYAATVIAPYVAEGPTAIVLVTDNLPNYGLGCDGTGSVEPPVDWTPLLALVQGAYDAGTHTLAVAAPATEPISEMLEPVAQLGGGAGLCVNAEADGCFFDLGLSVDMSAWLVDSLERVACPE